MAQRRLGFYASAPALGLLLCHGALSSQIVTWALVSCLYNMPPLYILYRAELRRRKRWMKAFDTFLSPLHRVAGLPPLTEFAWLTSDRLVQRTVFGSKLELVADFGRTPFQYRGFRLPGRSIMAHRLGSRGTQLYHPREEWATG